MSLIPAIVLAGATAWFGGPDARACPYVDSSAAEAVLGSGAADMSQDGDTTCIFNGPESWALLSIQVSDADFYDVVSILQPHTQTDIGDKGRYNVDESGNVAVQFVKGGSSVMVSLRVIRDREGDHLAAVLDLSRAVAAGLP